jgi:phage portal protein BeeE
MKSKLERPSVPLSEFDYDERDPITVTPEKALGIGAYFSCLKVLGETMGQMDLEVVEKVSKATRLNTH